MLVLIVNCQMLDKWRWTTDEQREFLDSYVPRYLEAQTSRKYHKFWPGLYQAWFAKYPEPDPEENDPTESEVEDDPDPDTISESDADDPGGAAGSKRKRASRKVRAKKLKKKVFQEFYLSYIHAEISRRRHRLLSF